MWAIVATWRMSLEAIEKHYHRLEDEDIEDVLEDIVKEVEDFPFFKSVGYGGLPNCAGEVEFDAGFMNGSNFNVGACASVKDVKNPISLARLLSKKKTNCFLVGQGAKDYAISCGLKIQDMLSDRAKIHYEKRVSELKEKDLKPYDGHDTVGVCVKQNDVLATATSTSGLFMKNPGRVGDSPLIGSGFYADSEYGCACATGLGEDLMKGLVSYEIVNLLKNGYDVQKACEKVIDDLEKKLKKIGRSCGDLSAVALDKNGNFAAASNIENFSFVYASKKVKPTVYILKKEKGKTIFKIADKKWIEEYLKKRMEPLK